jgi:uncharacterized membrane protein HdeD (DUF308 family)
MEASMLDVLTRYWWTLVIRGVAAVLFGLMALIWPGITVLALVLLFGAYAILDGVLALGAAALNDARSAGRRPWLVLEGIAGILTGIVTFAWPDVTTLVLLWLIAAWAIVTGVLEVVAAVRLRREIEGEWVLAASGVLSVVFGLLMMVWPASGAVALVVLIGVYAIVFGAALVALGWRLRAMRGTAGTPQPAAS